MLTGLLRPHRGNLTESLPLYTVGQSPRGPFRFKERDTDPASRWRVTNSLCRTALGMGGGVMSVCHTRKPLFLWSLATHPQSSAPVWHRSSELSLLGVHPENRNLRSSHYFPPFPPSQRNLCLVRVEEGNFLLHCVPSKTYRLCLKFLLLSQGFALLNLKSRNLLQDAVFASFFF